MLLHRVHLDPRSREARRDIADPYQLHATLSRAFSPTDVRLPSGSVLWRLEPEPGSGGAPRVLVQSRHPANWDRIGVRGWLAGCDPAIELRSRLALDQLQAGVQFRFRLRANPAVSRAGKRKGLVREEEQRSWLTRKGSMHGFAVTGATVTHAQMLRGRQHGGNGIHVYSVLFDGYLTVIDPATFIASLETGIGHGKALGLGLLSVVPAAPAGP